jgi:hypothetical protein
MFRVLFFCDDKHVPDVHRFMVGRAAKNPPYEIQPVENVSPNGTARTPGGMCDLFTMFCQDKVDSGVTKVWPQEIKSFLTQHNFKVSSISYALKCGKDFLHRHGKGNQVHYTISLPPSKPTKKIRRKKAR